MAVILSRGRWVNMAITPAGTKVGHFWNGMCLMFAIYRYILIIQVTTNVMRKVAQINQTRATHARHHFIDFEIYSIAG